MKYARMCTAIFRTQVLAKLQYRAAAFTHLSTTVLSSLIHITIILAFYRFGDSAGAGMSQAQAVSYTWLVHIVLHLLPGMGVDSEIKEKIKSGDVGVELCRPMDLYTHWFTRALAARLVPFLLQLVPMAVIAFCLPAPYRLLPPSSLWGLVTSTIALLLGLLLTCATMGLTYVVLMRVSWGDGPIYVMAVITDLLSGANLPLKLWPASLQKVLFLQPFAGIIDLPARLYLGILQPYALGQVAAIQISWTVVLTVAGWLLMKRNLTHLAIQGG